MNILIFVIILLVLVLVHEAGHFFTAKKFGIRVDEFGFGFPPKLFGIKRGETEYTFNAIPFGGFVKIFGENPDDENTNGPDKDRSFVNKPKWQQAIVLFAGIAANFLLAWLLFSIGFMSGLPTSAQSVSRDIALKDSHLTIVSVLKDSPSDKAGLKSGDKIVYLTSGVNTTEKVNVESVRSFISKYGDKEIEIGYLRGKTDEANFTRLTPSLNTENKPTIGIAMDEIGILKLPFFSAVLQGLKTTWSVTFSTFIGLFSIINQAIQGVDVSSALTGPVGMVGIVGDASQFGFAYLLSFAALISVNLAVLNVLPFPALDGGRLFFLLIEKIKGSRLNPKIANTANIIGFLILISLMLFVTYHDVVKLF